MDTISDDVPTPYRIDLFNLGPLVWVGVAVLALVIWWGT